MAPPSTHPTFIGAIAKHLALAEKALLVALVIGIVLIVIKIDSTVTSVTLVALGVTFFLRSYKPTDLPEPENGKFGFSELLSLVIVPKVLWISSAVSAVGISFFLFDFRNEGWEQMLMIGGVSIAVGVVVMLVVFASGVKHMRSVTPVLLRAVPLCLLDFYLLFR